MLVACTCLSLYTYRNETMELISLANTIDYIGRSQLVIEDAALASWAQKNGKLMREAPLAALRNGVIPMRYLKNFRALNLEEQHRICSGRVLICGCGGLGGALIHLLARAGVGFIRVVDSDVFFPSNLNRQWLCDTRQIGQSKALAAAEQIKSINPFIEVEAYSELIQEHNIHSLLQGMDLALDALDNLGGRFIVGGAARRLGIPLIHAAVAGWWGQIATFLPDSRLGLEDIYRNQCSRDPIEDEMGVLGTVVSVIGSIEAHEAISLLSGRKPAYADRMLYFDGETGRMEIIIL
jgi:molybdopterin/thiamine biosynthesis adenylyltransferase